MSDVTIPEDVIARVDAAVRKYGNWPILDGIKLAMAEVVADLVAAERERCAKIAEDMAQWRDVPASRRWDEDLQVWFDVAASRVRVMHGGEKIAQAIRSPHE